MKAFDERRIGDLYVKGFTSNLHKGANESERWTYTKSLSRSKFSVKISIEEKCVDSKTIEWMLQERFKKSKKMPAEQMTCMRRYAFEMNIIDPVDYDIKVSNLTSYDCESDFENFDEGLSAIKPHEPIFFGVNDRAISDCEKNKSESERLMRKALLRTSAIATFDLSPEQQSEIVNEMIGMLRSKSTTFLECVRDYCVARCEQY